MPRYIAFLRAINVGGRVVTMETLRKHFEALLFRDVESFIASGNILFTSNSTNTGALREKIEKHLRRVLGYEVGAYLRTEAEVAAIAQYRPFPDEQMKAAQVISVAFLNQPLDDGAIATVMAKRSAMDDFHVNEREFYWLCNTRTSMSKLFTFNFEKAFKARATFRNVNTVVRIAAKCAAAREEV